ncbi:sulfur carrier protein ThiS [Moellerella wisconsensis]|uniref:Sulfur carrier protein ThiS n=1 Tax=Moellerella wisconsensis TaxID=158849 RepID=A0ACD3YAR2_9GAMM|nr:sulfur carrier protein ThiS [Moellerella wisconsensis]UNH39161.1 sulfur carrier protein ThiS [Moellerella wisconsensis]
MRIIINNQIKEFESPLTVSQLLILLARSQAGTALAINQIIIPRAQWETHKINDGDNILLFQAIAGG